jgi:Domain of unknown function (DUF6285)
VPINSPNAAQLLTAVQEFLKDELLPELTSAQRYPLQVALNGIAIVTRELELGPTLDTAERERLRPLVGDAPALTQLNRLLCERIRARELTYRDGALVDHLLRTTLGKLSIDNPNYATYQQELARPAGQD